MILRCIAPEIGAQVVAEYNQAQENGDRKGIEAAMDKWNAHLNEIAHIIPLDKADYETYKANDAMPFGKAAVEAFLSGK